MPLHKLDLTKGWGWDGDGILITQKIYFQRKKKKENSDMKAFCNVHWILDNSIIFHRSLSEPLQASFQLNAYPTVIFLRYQKSYKFPNSVKYTKKVFPRKEKLGGYNKSCQRKTCLSGLSQSDRWFSFPLDMYTWLYSLYHHLGLWAILREDIIRKNTFSFWHCFLSSVSSKLPPLLS